MAVTNTTRYSTQPISLLYDAGGTTYYATIQNLIDGDVADTPDGHVVAVKEYHQGSSLGGGEFYWDASSTESDDGGTVISVIGVSTGRWKRIDTTLRAENFGIREGSENEASNKAIMLSLLGISDSEGGVIYFGEGEFYLGSTNFSYSNGPNYNRKGVIGSGVGKTTLHFNNAENVAAFSYSSNVFWNEFAHFTAVADGPAQLQNFLDSLSSGAPRSHIHDLRVVNFKDPFRIHSWVSTYERVVSSGSLVGFTWAKGTSNTVSSCYALNCKFGHAIGTELVTDGAEWDGSITWSGERGLSYGEFSGIAADGNSHASYIIGLTESVTLSDSGAELANRRWMVAPSLVNQPSGRETPLLIEQWKSWTNISDSTIPFLRVERNGFAADLEGINPHPIHSDSAKGIVFDSSVTFVNISIKNCMFGYRNIPETVSGVSVDGQTYGDVRARSSTFTRAESLRGTGIKKYSTFIPQFSGTSQLRMAFQGSLDQNESFMAKIHVALANNNTSMSSGFLFSGLVMINAGKDGGGSNVGVITLGQGGNTQVSAVVSTTSSNPSTASRDILFTFTGDSATAGATYMLGVEIATTADFSTNDPLADWRPIYTTTA